MRTGLRTEFINTRKVLMANELDASLNCELYFSCPICHNEYAQKDIISLYEMDGINVIEVCTECMRESERDLNKSITKNVLDEDTFQKIWDWACFEIKKEKATCEL